jgi:phosphate-selective porin OprO and OprP
MAGRTAVWCFVFLIGLAIRPIRAQDLSQADSSGLPAYGEAVSPASDDWVEAGLVDDPALSTPAAPIEDQVRELYLRLDALEQPTLKFPTPAVVNGVFQADAVLFNQNEANRDAVGYIENGADFRRARLGVRTALANNMNAFMQMDFAAQGRPSFTDVWVEWTDLPVLGNVRVGQWKQPFSLEVVSSFRYTTFMERSVLFQAFTPFRHIGVGAYNHRDDLMGTWAVSLIRTGQDQYGDSLSTAGGNGVVGRITRLAWYDEAEGRSYLHYGGGYFLNVPPHHAHRFRTIPEIFVGENRANGIGTAGFPVPGVFDGTPFFVDTGPLPGVEHVQTFGLEGLLIHGPLSIQAEAMTALVDRSASPTATLSGSYVQAGYFLTGEHRPYDRVAGAIDRVKPFEDFFLVNAGTGPCYGKGAWELALRWSYIDLNGGDIRGGSMNDLTAGVNWYCNPYSKVVFNFVHSWLDDRNGDESEANAFAMRTQMDF